MADSKAPEANQGTDLESELHSLLDEIDASDEHSKEIANWIENLDEEGLQKAFKKLNPYGVTIPSKSERSASFSYTNYSLEFAKQLATTSLIAYLFNQVKEWQVPDEVKPIDIDAYIADPSIADTPSSIKHETTVKKMEENRRTMHDRVAAFNFLKHIFDFDPDKHAASALTTNKGDPERRLANTKAVRRALRNTNNVRNVPKKDYEASKSDLNHVPSGEIETQAFNTIPSLDTFARLERYMDDNYEELLQTTRDIYGSRPDIDFAINIYDIHQSREEAEHFKTKHGSQVIAPITNVTCNKWALLGPYRQNRERVDYMNSQTELLKAMLDKREQDSHIATDIMKKRIKIKKKQNIEEAGPDDPAFRNYIKQHKPDINKLGATHVELEDEKKHDSSSDDEDDKKNIQVNMFTLEDGGAKLRKHKIYNPAEAPPTPDRKPSNDVKRV